MGKIRRARAALLALLAQGGAAAFLPSCDPFHTQFDDEEGAVKYEAKKLKPAELSSTLTVMNYNVKFGGGRIDFFFDCHGDRVLMTEDEVIDNLEGIAQVINAVDPDVVFLQEVDILSKRSAYVDQMQWLLDHTDMNYGVYASHWKADYVPSDGLGAVDSGNAILSKAKLKNATRLSLPLRSDQSSLTKYFYLQRNMLIADLDVTPSVRLVATHLDAYSQDGTKAEQIELFEEQLDLAPGLVIGAGDLNAVPPGSEKLKGFPDSVCTDEDFQADDYTDDKEVLVSLYDKYQSAIPLADYQANNEAYFSHTTDGNGFWNRTLDYVFTNMNVVPGSGVVHQDGSILGFDTMPLSDHAPVTVEIEVP